MQHLDVMRLAAKIEIARTLKTEGFHSGVRVVLNPSNELFVFPSYRGGEGVKVERVDPASWVVPDAVEAPIAANAVVADIIQHHMYTS